MRHGGTFALLKCSIAHWLADNASTTGAALAFYCAFSLAPLLVILLTIAAAVLGPQQAYGQIGVQLAALFGPATAQVLLEAVRGAQQAQGLIATIISAVTLLVGSTTVLAALESALRTIWGGTPPSGGYRSWLRTRVLSLAFILALGFLLLVSLTVSTGLSNLHQHLTHHYVAWTGVLALVDFVWSLLIVSCLFAVIYRYLPAHRLPWGVVLCGGVLTAVLFDIGRWAIGLYLAHSTEPSAFGAAASFAALLLWLYYSAQIFLFGAEFTACLGGLRDDPP